jgi:hypothetical protein
MAMMHLSSHTPARAVLALALLLLSFTLLCAAPAIAVASGAVSEASAARLTYVTGTARSPSPLVWVAAASGLEPKLLGPGGDPLLAPDGQLVAAALFGATANSEAGPSLAIYSTSGAPVTEYLSLATATATPLAWSADSRYLAVSLQSTAVNNIAQRSGLAVIDTQTGTATTIAHGQIYGASFAPAGFAPGASTPGGGDHLVFARAPSLAPRAPTNLYTSQPDGSAMKLLTHDGRSLNPVWGPRYIAYDRERMRHESPEYQIWLASPSGVRARKVTHVSVGPLVAGLVPLAFSASGSRLLAEFEGEDTSAAYTVNVASGHAREVSVHGRAVQGAGISRDGRTVLVDENAFEQPPSAGRVATIPFTGGRSRVLIAHGSQGSWNG